MSSCILAMFSSPVASVICLSLFLLSRRRPHPPLTWAPNRTFIFLPPKCCDHGESPWPGIDWREVNHETEPLRSSRTRASFSTGQHLEHTVCHGIYAISIRTISTSCSTLMQGSSLPTPSGWTHRGYLLVPGHFSKGIGFFDIRKNPIGFMVSTLFSPFALSPFFALAVW